MLFRKDISKWSDAEIIGHYRSDGQSSWVGELYNRYAHLVFGVCLKYLKDRDDAKDATLSLFEKLLEDLRTHEIRNFTSWLHTVARNHCLMMIRADKVRMQKLNGFRFEEAVQGGEEDLSALKEAGLVRLEAAIAQLNAEQEKCVRLFYLEERSYKEISERTGMSANEVKSHIQNGRRNLRLMLTGNA